MWLPVLELIAKLLTQMAAVFLLFKSGKDSQIKKELKETIKEGQIRNEIESEANDDSRAAVVKWLRDNKGDQ